LKDGNTAGTAEFEGAAGFAQEKTKSKVKTRLRSCKDTEDKRKQRADGIKASMCISHPHRRRSRAALFDDNFQPDFLVKYYICPLCSSTTQPAKNDPILYSSATCKP
jgi:hypothetical protein